MIFAKAGGFSFGLDADTVSPRPALATGHSGKLHPLALPSSHYRKHEVNPGRRVVIKVAHDIADMQSACPIPSQDDVIPAPVTISQRYGADDVSLLRGKPFHLPADEMLQIAVGQETADEFRSTDILDYHDPPRSSEG